MRQKIRRIVLLTFAILLAFPTQVFAKDEKTDLPSAASEMVPGYAIIYEGNKGDKYGVSVGIEGDFIGARMSEDKTYLWGRYYYSTGILFSQNQFLVPYVVDSKNLTNGGMGNQGKVVQVPSSNYYNGWVKSTDNGQEDIANAWDSTTDFSSQVNAMRLAAVAANHTYETQSIPGYTGKVTLVDVLHGMAPMMLQDPLVETPKDSISSLNQLKPPTMATALTEDSLKLMAEVDKVTSPSPSPSVKWGSEGRDYGMSQFKNLLKDVPTAGFDKDTFKTRLTGDNSITGLANYWSTASSVEDKRFCLLYLKYLLENYNKVEVDEDQKNQAGNIGGNTPDAGTTNPDPGSGLTEDVWDDWYKAAYKIAAGIDPTDSKWNMGSGYELAATLVGTDETGGYGSVSGDIGDTETIAFWRKAYDVLSLAYSRGNNVNTLSTWDPQGKSLKQAYDMLSKVSEAKGGTAIDGIQRYANAQNKLAELAAAGGDTIYKRMGSFNERISALYHISTMNDVNFGNDKYKWVPEYYEMDNSEIFIPDTYFTDGAGHIPNLLEFNGSAYTAYPALPSGDVSNPYVLPYLLQTVWELPYICNYMAEPMNEAIKNSTIMDRQDLYNALKSINDSVNEIGLKVLTDMWEWETSKDVPYKSLKAMWEACQKDPKVQQAGETETPEAEKKLSSGKPLGDFLTDYVSKLSDNYVKGIAYTATLVPMKSNVYSSEWINFISGDETFYKEFYYLWGFNRKALYRDTTSGAGEEYFNSGKTSKGNLEVCTLRDLIESKDDIVLYLDDNFYNANDLQQDLSGYASYGAETTNTSESGTETTPAPPWWQSVAAKVEETYTAGFKNIVKTGSSTNYSKTFYEMMSQVDDAHTYYPEATVTNPGNKDNIVLSSGKINYYLKQGNTGSEIYSPLQSYAVISSIYRDGELYTIANSREVQRPVFISSKSAPYAMGADMEQQSTIFNYALVRNLKGAMPIDYAGNLDMDCPLYMDILGNIITESGTVIVPAASNATIMSHTDFYRNQWGAGLFAIYGVDYKIPVKKNDDKTILSVLSNTFEMDTTGKYYIPKARALGDDGYKVDMSRLSITSKDTLQTLYDRTYGDIKNSLTTEKPLYDYYSYVQICLEVLRGAPIDEIDKTAEGIDTDTRMNKAGIVAAAKLEDLNKSLGTNGENTTLSLPNMAFMPGFNYVALMAFKIVLLVVIIINMATVYLDAVGGGLGIGTFFKCIWAMVLTVLTVLTVPTVFEATYYQSNRALLQDETAYISMLNLEKSESGVEIGVTEVSEPEIKTQLYLKLEDVKVPWYELFYNSIYTDTFKTLNNLYDNYAQEHSTVANENDIIIKNDGVYVDVNDIYASSSVDFDIKATDPNVRRLVQTSSDKTSTFSFYSPYYALLDALIQNVNYYNAYPRGNETGDNVQGWYSYTTKTQKGGRLKTVGLIEPYFTSSAFMEDEGRDILGLKTVYKDLFTDMYVPDAATGKLYTPNNLLAMSRSYWYPEGMSDVEVEKRMDYLVKEARTFVSDNRDMLGKISDETFLKVMAMNLAVKHNRVFGCSMASSFEIYNLSSDDLIRLSIADRSNVMLNSTLSYPRFVYVVGGTSSVFAAAILSMIMWISGIVKPLLVIVAFVTIFVSIFVFRVCMKKSGTSLYGYVITTLLLCGTNLLYSVILKLSMYLPVLGLTPFMCLVIQALVQIVYMVVLLNVVGTAFRDWRDLGYARYAHKTGDLRTGLFGRLHKDRDNSSNPFYGGSSARSDPEKNWNYYDDMIEQRKRRSRDGQD